MSPSCWRQTFGDNQSSGVQGACYNNNNNSGSLGGTFNQNNAGTLIPPAPLDLNQIGISFPNNTSEGSPNNPYTYVSTSNTGRYIFCMLGNPLDTNPGLPIPFVLYASGANRGYLLDQSSSSVMTGTMNVQVSPKQNGGLFAGATATGTYAVATASNSIPSSSACTDLTSCYATVNLLLYSSASGVLNFSGSESPSGQLSGTYVVDASGLGALTIPGNPYSTNLVIYGVTETNFFMIGWDQEETGPPPVYNSLIGPILYMAQ